uniref:ATP-dependent RNA helicase n=1 Tax=Strongyloides stercoralis TaxID=6248 RepID=A0A0K0ECJ3_STRER
MSLFSKDTNKCVNVQFTSDEESGGEITFNTEKRFSEIKRRRNQFNRLPFGYKPELRDPEKIIIQKQGMMAPKDAFEYNCDQTYYASNEELNDKVDTILQSKNYKTFEDLGINKEVLKILRKMNKRDLTAIQQCVCPLVKERICDVIASAPTGFGKTYAYIIPIIDYIIRKRSASSDGFSIGRSPLGMMLAVTRDLAKQLMEDVQTLTKDTSFRAVLIYGEINNRDIQINLEKGCDFIIACIGRLKTLVGRKIVDLENLRYLVIDEADKFVTDPTSLYEMNEFIKESDINQNKRLIKVLTSAVIDEEILDDVVSLFSPKSRYVFINHSKSRTYWNVKEDFVLINGYDRFNALLEILKSIKSKEPTAKIIVFFGSRNEMDLAATWMNLSNIPNKSISGNRSQEMRDKAMKVIDEVPGTILISTDITERGVDVKGAKYVIHHNVPQKYRKYINRIGRVGRHEGSEGISIMLVANTIDYASDIKSLVEDMIKYKYNVPPKLLNYHEECERERIRIEKCRFMDLKTGYHITGEYAPGWASDLKID